MSIDGTGVGDDGASDVGSVDCCRWLCVDVGDGKNVDSEIM